MEINDILNDKISEIKSIITDFEMNIDFSSHDFIEKFTERYEEEYIDMLVKHKKTGRAFQTVHSIIAKFLSQNKSDLGIEKIERKASENVRGNIDYIQWWKRVD